MQRSGSGWFETLLNSHINVSSNGEIFGKRARRASVSAITQTLDRVYNLDWFSSASKNECNAAVGFKWMLNQVSGFVVLLVDFLSFRSSTLLPRMIMFLLRCLSKLGHISCSRVIICVICCVNLLPWRIMNLAPSPF